MNNKGEKILAVIVARGGSKVIPRKNILDFKGKPLVAWPIELARSVSIIDKVIVSTDSEEIAEIARKYGAEVPFMRPSELAADDTPTLPVLQHAVKELENSHNFKADIVALFYPTSPLLKRDRVNEALALFENTDCQSVVSVVKDFGRFWKTNRPFYPENRVNRQYFEPLLRENGAIYFARYDLLVNENKIVDEKNTSLVIMDPEESIDIDTLQDLEKAQTN